jgi:hypothetical protein
MANANNQPSNAIPQPSDNKYNADPTLWYDLGLQLIMNGLIKVRQDLIASDPSSPSHKDLIDLETYWVGALVQWSSGVQNKWKYVGTNDDIV